MEYVKSVREAIKKCIAERGVSCAVDCNEDFTPKKCKGKALDMFDFNKEGANFSWYNCVSTCYDAGLYSRTFGECSR